MLLGEDTLKLELKTQSYFLGLGQWLPLWRLV